MKAVDIRSFFKKEKDEGSEAQVRLEKEEEEEEEEDEEEEEVEEEEEEDEEEEEEKEEEELPPAANHPGKSKVRKNDENHLDSTIISPSLKSISRQLSS